MPPPDRKAATDYHYHAYDYEGAQAWVPGPAQIKRNDYTFYSMVKDLNGLVQTGKDNNVPNIKLINIPGTAGGRNTIGLAFGNIADDPTRPTVVITGGIHAREWMAHEMAYLLAEYLIMHFTLLPVTEYQRAIRDLVITRNIRIFPMVNPDGNHYTVFGEDEGDEPAREWRKNRRALPVTGAAWATEISPFGNTNKPFEDVRELDEPATMEETDWVYQAEYDVPYYDPGKKIPPGDANYETRMLFNNQTGVDPNRNWTTRAWGYDCLRPVEDEFYAFDWNPAGGSYFGSKRGGEAETANIQGYLGYAGGYGAAIDYHSYGRVIAYPSEAYHNGEVTPDYTNLGNVLEQLIESEDGKHYTLGTSLSTVKYDATGATDDHMAWWHDARAFTVELDPEEEDPGFLLPETKIMACFETNIRGALAAIAWPNPAALPREMILRQELFAGILNKYQRWKVYGLGNQLPSE
jgi:Zinc carboxypeptidase